MELGRHPSHAQGPYVRRKQAIESFSYYLRVPLLSTQDKMRALADSVHAAISAPTAYDANRLSSHSGNRRFDRRLNTWPPPMSSSPTLALPPSVARTGIGKDNGIFMIIR